MRYAVIAGAFVAQVLVTPVAAQSSDKLTLADYLDWEGVAAPKFSPDGKQIIRIDQAAHAAQRA